MSVTETAAAIGAFAAVGMLGLGILAAVRAWVTTERSKAAREGKVDEILDRLTDMTEDHERRLRRGRL